jgi:hypothetical protein
MAAVEEEGEKPYFGPAIWLSRHSATTSRTARLRFC